MRIMLKRATMPLVDLKREFAFLKRDVEKAIHSCCVSQQWILGSAVSEFEKRIARYINVKHAIGVASGTDALLLSLSALALNRKKKPHFDKKDEIITTPFTFIATAEAIMRSGATPVFVDINPETFNIDPAAIEKAITKNTVGIVPVHLYGLSADMQRICACAKKYNLFIVEDCAQAFGGTYYGKKLGSFSDCGAFSFFPSKNLAAYGDAGCITTSNDNLAEIVRMLRNHGQDKEGDARYLGYNSRLDALQAAILLAKHKHINTFIALRRNIARKYNLLLRQSRFVQTPSAAKFYYHVYGVYTIKVSSKRKQFMNYLHNQGISARIYYPKPLTAMKLLKTAKQKGTFKGLQDVLPKVISLPMHPFLKYEEIAYISRAIHAFYGS